MAKLLVIDDDAALLRALRIGLQSLGHEVAVATTGTRGLSETALLRPDAVVLDLGLPDIDGVEVCRRIREWSEVPIIVLSADDNEDRKVAALDIGADDYVIKPFGMNELDARLRVALRHAASAQGVGDSVAELTVGPLSIDLPNHEVRLDDELVELTPREFELLAYLARHVGKVCTHRMILEAVWGNSHGRATHYLREYTYRLRRKLGDEEGNFLRTRPGVGYQLVPPDVPVATR